MSQIVHHASSIFLNPVRLAELPSRFIDGSSLTEYAYLGSLATPGSGRLQHYYAAKEQEAFICYRDIAGPHVLPSLIFRADDMKTRCRSIIRMMNAISPDVRPRWSGRYE